jgi:hypothetical protein
LVSGDAREGQWPFSTVGLQAGPPTRTAPIRRERIRRTPTERDEVVIPVDFDRIRNVLWLVTGTLVALDFLVSVASGLRVLPYTITRFFDGDSKVNFPTGAKTTMLLATAVLMLGCWTAGRRRNDPASRGWLLLSLVTAFAFLDETIWLHQSLNQVLTNRFHFQGLLKFSWTIVYLPAAVLVGIFLLKNLRLMRPGVRNRLLPGGAIYAAGAMLLEPIKSQVADGPGDDSPAFKLVSAVSDSMELIGLTVLLLAVLVAARHLTAGFSFAFSAPRDPPDAGAPGSAAGGASGGPGASDDRPAGRATGRIDPGPAQTRIVDLP